MDQIKGVYIYNFLSDLTCDKLQLRVSMKLFFPEVRVDRGLSEVRRTVTSDQVPGRNGVWFYGGGGASGGF